MEGADEGLGPELSAGVVGTEWVWGVRRVSYGSPKCTRGVVVAVEMASWRVSPGERVLHS